ncbi:MAG: hypothetical protein A3A80_03740 [Candidatus Terrybacteria bacterium RIFCSPLOWO2_01_FULL_44_24]|uniref:Uncharacterized protein n=1 Tax=Candidatus Terrybacteria bacterium RIFCSPHIGHO2_01_FULL_43_35 TaxID=1802361 RepID=A0A1G2PI44_9BACT|nr:MAG: hypothetical protein A2828_00070 [Candidatus Terrybacteria bacterium RIFCSPHIGHO2_01_FULL_43_35]OHA49304.1 MAG: hypothetical protein A3B75_02445 [Candidatus Terrybacteria bacterium RIFCSPHIGHO2_02_FULL_43_14]OHA52002.1 MAG: hypothetical protein A3A80_03740 [Candidatus Terrybacteria bacterium RIFCSPLOWO2_01_FULL_44_24]
MKEIKPSQQITPALQYLLNSQHELRLKENAPELPGERIHVSEAISKVSAFYEYLRMSAEYTEEHLIFRSVIERILKRRIFIQMQDDAKELSSGLIKEVISGGYLPNDSVHLDEIDVIATILNRYLALFQVIEDRSSDLNDFLVQLASVEIERGFSKLEREKEESFAHFAFMVMRDHIQWAKGLSEAPEHELEIFIAILRGILQYDDPQISFAIFRSAISGWSSLNPKEASARAQEILTFWKNTKNWLEHPHHEFYLRVVRQLNPSFLIVRDVLSHHPQQASEVFADYDRLHRAVNAAAEAKYSSAKARLRHRASRATIYIFLTKMLMALGIEVPYDLFLVSHFAPVPLVINLLFPPALMFFMGATTPIPSKKNTERIIKDVNKIVYVQGKGEMLRIVAYPKVRGSIQRILFATFLVALFVISFGLVAFLLKTMQFNIVSGGVFMFFLTVVSLFAYRIRKPVRELFVKDLEGGLSTLFFLITYPLVIVGHFLSDGAAKINIPVIFLDIFVEAPLKSFLEVGEDWLSFLREKQEEIV